MGDGWAGARWSPVANVPSPSLETNLRVVLREEKVPLTRDTKIIRDRQKVFSVIVILQTSRRFVYSSSGDGHCGAGFCLQSVT